MSKKIPPIQNRWKKDAENKEKAKNQTADAREQRLLNIIEEKKMEIKSLKNYISQFQPIIENFEQIKLNFPFLFYLFQSASEKISRKGSLIHGIRYQALLIPYILLLSLFGKKLSLFLHLIIGVPTWGTIMAWKKKYIQKYKISLDGSQDSINNIIDSYMGGVRDDRIVLSIDAASVSARVSVSEEGNVKGLLYTKIIENANQILSSSEDFASFVEEHYPEIIRYYFVVYACPLSSDAQSFPIALIPRISGNASKEIVTIFQQIVKRVNQKLNVVGTAFDGDSGWLFLAKQAALTSKENIINAILGDKPLLSLDNYMFYNDDDHPNFLIFEDPLHLLKCFRYRLCSGCGICPSVFSDENNFISRDNFESVGIPPWLIDGAKYLKMDDGLPLKLFTFENIEKCVLSGRIDLAYALIPPTLLKDAIMDNEIDRLTRIEMLSLGYSIVMLYLCELEKYSTKKNSRLQKTSKNGGKNTHLTLMDKKWCSKYLSLCISLVCILKDPKSVELGALGSHWLEHFFGLVRQTSKGNDTFEKFEECVYNAILSNFIEKEIGVKLISPKRVSSSGASLPEVDEIPEFNLSFSLYMASKLHLRVSPGVYNEDLFNKIAQFQMEDPFVDEIQYIMLLLQKETKIPKTRTTSSERLAVSVCKSQRKNLSLSSQLNYKNQSDETESFSNSRPSLENNVRRSPRRQIQSAEVEDEFDEQIDNAVTHASTYGMNSVSIRCQNGEEIEGINIDSLLQATVPDDMPLASEE